MSDETSGYLCPDCGRRMKKLPEKRPYITHKGIVYHNVRVDVFACPDCGKETEILPNEEDGYSAGAGLFSED